MSTAECLAFYFYVVGAWAVGVNVWNSRPRGNVPDSAAVLFTLLVLTWPISVPLCAAFVPGRKP